MDSGRVCRICLGESSNMEPLFAFSSTSRMMLTTAISIVTSLQFSQEDGLPQAVCTSCSLDAQKALEFKQKCIESDKELRARLIIVKNEVQSLNGIQNDLVTEGLDVNRDDFLNEDILNGLINEFGTLPAFPEKRQLESISEYRPRKMGRIGCKTNETVKEPLTVTNVEEKELSRERMHSNKKALVNNKTFKCKECSKVYTSEASILMHMETHSTKVYSCQRCQEHFPDNKMLELHTKLHAGERTFGCAVCDKKFYSKTLLDRHNKRHRPIGPLQQFECPICRKPFLSDNRMKTHILSHMRLLKDPTEAIAIKENPTTDDFEEPKNMWLCTICGVGCKSSSNLAVHERRHTGEMTNFCNICGKGYPRKTDLTVHMRKHTGEKPFQCPICKREFARSDKLTIHLRIHSGEKPYVCNVCNKAFIQSNDLASHKRKDRCAGMIF